MYNHSCYKFGGILAQLLNEHTHRLRINPIRTLNNPKLIPTILPTDHYKLRGRSIGPLHQNSELVKLVYVGNGHDLVEVDGELLMPLLFLALVEGDHFGGHRDVLAVDLVVVGPAPELLQLQRKLLC